MENKTDDKAEPKKRRGNAIGGSRPLELTPQMFEEAGRFALTWRHMAAVYGVSQMTIADRMKEPEFKESYERGKLKSQNEVIQFLFASMRNGSLKAGIFLAQAWCHLSTKHEVKTDETHTTRYIVEVPPDSPTLDAWSKAHVPPPAIIDEAKRVN
jgi:hypothetical protein